MEKVAQLLDKYGTNLINLLIGLGILLVFIFASGIIKRIIAKKVKPKTKNPLLAEFLGKILALIITLIGFVLFLEIIGLGGFAKHIIAGAGVTTFIIGFAFKDIGENFLSGILLAFKSPFNVGDLIENGSIIGYVYELNLRETKVKSLDGKDIFIPNSQIIKNPLINYTIDGYLRYELIIGIDYNSDYQKVMDSITDCLKTIPEVLQDDKKPIVIIHELQASSLALRLMYWIDTSKSKSKAYHLKIKSKVTKALLEMLINNKVYMPGNVVELKNYNDTAFSTSSK